MSFGLRKLEARAVVEEPLRKSFGTDPTPRKLGTGQSPDFLRVETEFNSAEISSPRRNFANKLRAVKIDMVRIDEIVPELD